MLSDDRTRVPKLELDVAHIFRLGGNLMYIGDVHSCSVVPWKNPCDFSPCRAICPFVLEISAPLRGIIIVILCSKYGSYDMDAMSWTLLLGKSPHRMFFPFQ